MRQLKSSSGLFEIRLKEDKEYKKKSSSDYGQYNFKIPTSNFVKKLNNSRRKSRKKSALIM